MRKVLIVCLAAFLAAAVNAALAQEQAAEAQTKPISWDNWREARAAAEKYDQEGKFVEALQCYLEYVRQAEGLGNRELVAWGKNNAAYMIIKRHKLDATVDLTPAKKFLEEAMAIDEAAEECKKHLAANMEYVEFFLKK